MRAIHNCKQFWKLDGSENITLPTRACFYQRCLLMPLFPFAIISARSSEKQSQPTLSLSADEAHSDDSDDIVIVSPLLRMKKNSTHFCNGPQ